MYQTANQNLFFQRNPNDSSSMVAGLISVLDDIPGIGGIVQSLVNATTAPYQVTGAQARNIKSGLQNSGYHVHHCFNHPITA